MEQIENMAKATMAEIEKVLSSKSVVGEPIKVGDVTLIPLLSIGFGFGAGGGSGKGEARQKGQGMGEGSGGGMGGGAWIRPKAVIIVDKEGVSVEPIRGGLAMAAERLAGVLPALMEKCMERCAEKRAKGASEKEE